MYQIWRVYLDAMQKWIWFIVHCSISLSDPNTMKLTHDMSRHQLNLYTKF